MEALPQNLPGVIIPCLNGTFSGRNCSDTGALTQMRRITNTNLMDQFFHENVSFKAHDKCKTSI